MSILVGSMCSICCHVAFMHLYNIFDLRLLLSIFFHLKKKSGIETPGPKWSMAFTYAHAGVDDRDLDARL